MKKLSKIKNKYSFFNLKQFSKFVVLLLVISIFSSITGINSTSAYFTDSATITGNTFTAGSLAFHLNPETDFISNPLNKGNSASFQTSVVNDGSLGFQYTVSATDLPTNRELCNALNITAKLNGITVYDELLTSLNTPAGSYTSSSDWNFTVTLPTGSPDTLQDKTCSFKLTFKGWQENLSSTQGFSDTASINATISSGHWVVAPPTNISGDVVINEVMWMGSSKSDADEWLELRNMTPNDINLNNWKLKNSAKSHGTLTLSGMLPAYGFFVIGNYDKDDSAINVVVNQIDNDITFYNEYDDNGRINLIDSNNNTIDSTPVPPTNHKWPAGERSGRSWSMERNLIPGIGSLDSSWHTCDADHMNSIDKETMESYWDLVEKGKGNCGTPGHINLSANDPTSPDYDPILFSDTISIDSTKAVEPSESSLSLKSTPPVTAADENIADKKEEISAEEIIKIEPILESPTIDAKPEKILTQEPTKIEITTEELTLTEGEQDLAVDAKEEAPVVEAEATADTPVSE